MACTVLGIAIALYLVLVNEPVQSLIVASLSVIPIVVATFIRRRRVVGARLDLTLLIAITHMYCLSLGHVGSRELVGAIAEDKEYGVYSKVFRRIADLAFKLGYGLTRAMEVLAKTVKPPLKDVLMRLSMAMSSKVPQEHLGLEATTMTEEYLGEYERRVESLRTMGGVYATIVSVSVLAIMVSSLLTIFFENPTIPAFTYLLAVMLLMTVSMALKGIAPAERLVYIGASPPRAYILFRSSLLLALLMLPFAMLVVIAREDGGLPYALIGIGTFMLIPGLLAYKLELYVKSIDRFYPTFIKVLGENLTSTSDFRSALSYVLYMELGPFKEHVKRALNRIKAGVAVEKALQLTASEAASYQVHVLNNIFVKSFKAGSRPLDVGRVLSTLAIRLLELRNRRWVVSRTFEFVLMMLQPIVVALLIILTSLASFFSRTITSLPYFELGVIPVSLVKYGVAAVIVAMAVLNSLAISYVRGGFGGTSLLYIGLLLLESGATWIGASKLIDALLGQFVSGPTLP